MSFFVSKPNLEATVTAPPPKEWAIIHSTSPI